MDRDRITSVLLSKQSPARPRTTCTRTSNYCYEGKHTFRRNLNAGCSMLRHRYDEHRTGSPREQDMRRDTYSFIQDIRPISAPQSTAFQSAVSRRKRFALMSAKAKGGCAHGQLKVNVREHQDMFALVRAAKDAKTFEEDAKYYKQIEASIAEPEHGEEKKDTAPVFNKRLFASQGAVIITGEARRLMAINASTNENCDLHSLLTKTEVLCLRCVVNGLKLIHKGQDFVKDVLSKVVSYEMYKSFEYVPTKSWEENLACYYILNGAVEVTYDLRATQSRKVYQANIIYSHGTGEYLGLVSPEGPMEDLAPPATIYTKELTQFIRVDRQRFHTLMQRATGLIVKRKRDYISSHSFLSHVSEEVREKVLHKLNIQEYPANRVLLSQGEVTDYLFIIMSGRCQTYREVRIPEAEREILFYLTSRDSDDFFGEECVLDLAPSACTIVTATATTLIKLHRSALKMVHKDKLSLFIEVKRHEIPSDENLRDRGYRDSLWNKFKHTQIKGSLKEGGKMQYLSRPNSALVRERPLGESEVHIENMRRFLVKGSQFEPMRAQSANTSGNRMRHRHPRRPHTALAGLVTETNISSGEGDMEEEIDAGGDVDLGQPQHSRVSSLLTIEKARNMEQNITKAMESKESLLKALDEPGDLGTQLRQAWKAEATEEAHNFMKNGVLVTMTSEDIVRKAKALADTYADKWKEPTNENEEDWGTILHAENNQAKMLITANRIRIRDLKRRLVELQKRREREQQRSKPRLAGYISDSDDDDDQQVIVHKDGNMSDLVNAATDDDNTINDFNRDMNVNSTNDIVKPERAMMIVHKDGNMSDLAKAATGDDNTINDFNKDMNVNSTTYLTATTTTNR